MHIEPPATLPPAEQEKLDALMRKLEGLRSRHLGYPMNHSFDASVVYPLLGHSTNNIGDPFSDSNTKENTHPFEREVIEEFARLTHAPEDEFWGYVTNGGTEGNMYGLFLARELHPEGIVYYSEDTHYSVAKILRLMGMRSIMIRSLENGEIDYDDLRETLKLRRDAPPILFLNVGTTMTGAIDSLDQVQAILGELCLSRHYIHMDAALMGMMLPFIDDAPAWDFRGKIDSLSISGHKFIGAPIPCGIVLARKGHVDRIARSVEYVGAIDTTIMGSRDGISPVVLWYALKTKGRDGFRESVQACLDMAAYAIRALGERGIRAWRNSPSITVVFPRPSAALFEKWTLAPYRDICHLITMPHVTRDMIDELADDLAADPDIIRTLKALEPALSLTKP